MDEKVINFVGKTLRTVLSALQQVPLTEYEYHQVWRRNEQGSWSGHQEPRLSLLPLLVNKAVDWDGLGKQVEQAIHEHYPEYAGLVGTTSARGQLIGSHVLQKMVWQLWHRHQTFAVDDEAIHQLLSEFAAFFDQPTIRMAILAPLLHFRMDKATGAIPLPGGLTIRHLTDEEVSNIVGGPVTMLAVLPGWRGHSMPECALTGEFDEPKITGDVEVAESPAFAKAEADIARAMLALRTFKAGRVGCDGIRLTPRFFVPIAFGMMISGTEHVPFGNYQLSAEEVTPLREHATAIFANLHSSLDVACSRLADAELRLQDRDRVIDAVIGLEAILLAELGKGKKEYVGESRFRFALNYSTLFAASPAEHYQAFLLARGMFTTCGAGSPTAARPTRGK